MGIFKRLLTLGVALGAALALSITPASGAKSGGGGGGGGAPGETTVSNNLSVPTVFVGSVGFGLPMITSGTTTELVAPSGTPLTGYEASGYYYVQGVHTWRAQYSLASSASATGKWGDNLSGDAKLKVGSPVRVEMGLTSESVTLQGYGVIKLEESKLDRESAYGSLATQATDGNFSATAAAMSARVWTSGAVLVITGPSGETASMPGEINATGAVVFGYNWWPKAAGIYTLTFTVPSTSGVTISNATDMVKIVTVLASGGGSGGGRR